MKKLKTILVLLFQLSLINGVKAQIDPHFSQYYAYPLWLNPALTGIVDGKGRINANFKDQWANIEQGYKTVGLSADFHSGDKVGLGLNIIDQSAGTAGYNYFAAYASFGYGFSISDDDMQKVHFGLQAGFINRIFNPSKLQLDNQYDPTVGFDPSLPSYENFLTTNSTVFDAGAGIFYYNADPQNNSNLFAGLSLAHLNSPPDPFTINGIKSRLPIRITANAGIKIKASDNLLITPHAIYIKQNQNTIKALGIYSELKSNGVNSLVFGGMYRLNDAAVANIGYHINTILIGLSYDFNTSALRTATNAQGGVELSLSYLIPNTSFSNSNVISGF